MFYENLVFCSNYHYFIVFRQKTSPQSCERRSPTIGRRWMLVRW